MKMFMSKNADVGQVIMSIQEKIKELKNVTCIGIKEKKLDFYIFKIER